MYKSFAATAALATTVAISMAANAADLPRPGPAPAPAYVPPPFTWTGLYIGGHIGGAWAHREISNTRRGLDFGQTNSDGVFIGGAQVGYNYQFNTFVLGVEADFSWVANDNNGGDGVIVPGVGTVRVALENKSITTVAARFGVAFDRILLYGKAGGGWVGHDDLTITNVTTGASISAGNDGTRSGFLLGAGIEWVFMDNWSAKVEYNYLGLDSRTFVVPAGAPVFAGDTINHGDRNVQMVKVGANYRFNFGAIR
jgi:outer membrane immunogenic protein